MGTIRRKWQSIRKRTSDLGRCMMGGWSPLHRSQDPQYRLRKASSTAILFHIPRQSRQSRTRQQRQGAPSTQSRQPKASEAKVLRKGVWKSRDPFSASQNGGDTAYGMKYSCLHYSRKKGHKMGCHTICMPLCPELAVLRSTDKGPRDSCCPL